MDIEEENKGKRWLFARRFMMTKTDLDHTAPGHMCMTNGKIASKVLDRKKHTTWWICTHTSPATGTTRPVTARRTSSASTNGLYTDPVSARPKWFSHEASDTDV